MAFVTRESATAFTSAFCSSSFFQVATSFATASLSPGISRAASSLRISGIPGPPSPVSRGFGSREHSYEGYTNSVMLWWQCMQAHGGMGSTAPLPPH
jgi:hypothetical protein